MSSCASKSVVTTSAAAQRSGDAQVSASPAARVFRQLSSTWNPPQQPKPGSDGSISKEDNAEYVHLLFKYMHNLHAQKLEAYCKLENALKQQQYMEAEIHLLKGMLGLPQCVPRTETHVELVVAHYPCLELHWVDICLRSLPQSMAGGCYLIWRPPRSMQIQTQQGFTPLCVSIIEPVVDPSTREFTREGGKLSHRYIFVVNGSAEGSWAKARGSVVVNDKPWTSDAHTLRQGGNCFESLDAFIRQSPDLMKEITTYKFPSTATKPYMMEYLEKEMLKLKSVNEDYQPQIKEVIIEDIKPLMIHHHHETTELQDGSVVLRSKTLDSDDASRGWSLDDASKGWTKIKGMTRGAQAARESRQLHPVPERNGLETVEGMMIPRRSRAVRHVQLKRKLRQPYSSPSPGGQVAGVGIGFERGSDGVHTVCDLFTGGTAAESGQIVIGDIIVAVDGVRTLGLMVEEVKQLIIGEVDAYVTITVAARSIRTVRIKRRLIVDSDPGSTLDPEKAGIGLAFARGADGCFTVCDLFQGGTARESKQLLLGDRLIAVDGVYVQGLAVENVVDMVTAGKEGSEVELTVETLPEEDNQILPPPTLSLMLAEALETPAGSGGVPEDLRDRALT